MSTFPEGNFTIVNNETGRCVRVRLGQTTDVSDWKEGTKCLQYVTDNRFWNWASRTARRRPSGGISNAVPGAAAPSS
ncbi:hypothetical protein [Streptomyces lavendulae]